MKCRCCQKKLVTSFLDLGFAPPSNAYLTLADLSRPETYYPLRVRVCEECWLVQTEDFAASETFFTPDYAYLSSTSTSWVAHARNYVNQIICELNLEEDNFVVEVASNDGYLLKNFVDQNIPCLGIEPTDSTAIIAEGKGIPVCREFFGSQLADKLATKNKKADLIIGNNVYAHVPDINDFTLGMKRLLKPKGTITLEFPHLLRLIENSQFDTVYHEHFSYLSLTVVRRIFEAAGLRIWKVDELTTHGGSLRVYGCHSVDGRNEDISVSKLLREEESFGLTNLKVYMEFQKHAEKIKNDLVNFLLEQKMRGKVVAAYGAAAKGNTLLNYAGVKPDLISTVFDAAVSKQGKFMPGSHIPIVSPSEMKNHKIDYLLILPWNIASEVIEQNSFLQENETQFVTAVPELLVTR